MTRLLLHHCHELNVVGCLLGCLLVRVSGSLLGSADGGGEVSAANCSDVSFLGLLELLS